MEEVQREGTPKGHCCESTNGIDYVRNRPQMRGPWFRALSACGPAETNVWGLAVHQALAIAVHSARHVFL